MELAALPAGAAEDGLARGPQAGMIVGDDVGHAAHATGNEALQEDTPMDRRPRRWRKRRRAPGGAIGADADRRKHGGVTHDPSLADLLVARVEKQIADLAQGAVAPGFQLLVQELGGAAAWLDDGSQAELAHDGLGIAGGDAFYVHLGHRQHDGAAERRPRSKALG